MEKTYDFRDPYFKTTRTEENNGIHIGFPVVEEDTLIDVCTQIKTYAKSYFSTCSKEELQKNSDKTDASFVDTSLP